LLAPIAKFQLLKATTPAVSELSIVSVFKPVKSMLIPLAVCEDVVTFSVKAVECVAVPLVPVIVIVEVPGTALVVALNVSVEVPDPLIELGLNDAVTPDGRPLALKFTVPENGPAGFTVMLIVALPPAATFCVVGVADSEKSGVTVIMRVGGLGSVTPELSVTVSDVT
jgi:hypothetical protein